MVAYNIDISKYLDENKNYKLSFYNDKKGPLKENTAIVFKNNDGRVQYSYEKPVQLKIAGQHVPNVYSCSVIDYKDGVTNNGKCYDIVTDKSKISLYTHDNKFALLREYFPEHHTLNVNDKKLYGNVTRTLFKDGSQEYQIISPNFNVKTVKLDTLGKEIVPKQIKKANGMGKMLLKIFSIMKMLF